MDALQTATLRVHTAPLVSGLVQSGVTATCRTETVATVPGQGGARLGHHPCRKEHTKEQVGKTLKWDLSQSIEALEVFMENVVVKWVQCFSQGLN